LCELAHCRFLSAMALSLCAGFAPAFTPPALPARVEPRSAVSMGVETELGATGPLGYWDPLGFSQKAPEKFSRYRAVELKHGRVAMMACTGYIVQSFFRFPGFLSTSENIKFADLPNGLLGFAGIPPLGLLQILLAIGLMEGITWPFYKNKTWEVPEGKLPGDVAGDFWVRYPDPEVKAYKLNVEINNGRAAMMGITGMLAHDHLTGSWIPPGF